MSKFAFLLIAVIVAVTSAFQPRVSHVTSVKPVAFTSPNRDVASPNMLTSLSMADEADTTALDETNDPYFDGMFWNGEYPPSKVLGPIMSKMPSNLLAVLAILSAAACAGGIGASQELIRSDPNSIATGSWIQWQNVAGSFAGPFAWGFHVACWIQRKNGM
mmetsp:Transcript_21028/g.24194  ORF Transcript_21028/g.24194 Transcript_21028/m.24194 type:complete len:161 (+) Transcript_21028:87-569(+)